MQPDINDLITTYGEATVKEAFEAWQTDDGVHPFTCAEGHGPLVWLDKVLVCPKCFYHQHWMPEGVIESYLRGKSID